MILIPESQMRFQPVTWRQDTPTWVKAFFWVFVGVALGLISVLGAIGILAYIFNVF